jgi:hypothetical protein
MRQNDVERREPPPPTGSARPAVSGHRRVAASSARPSSGYPAPQIATRRRASSLCGSFSTWRRASARRAVCRRAPFAIEIGPAEGRGWTYGLLSSRPVSATWVRKEVSRQAVRLHRRGPSLPADRRRSDQRHRQPSIDRNSARWWRSGCWRSGWVQPVIAPKRSACRAVCDRNHTHPGASSGSSSVRSIAGYRFRKSRVTRKCSVSS